MEKKMVRFVVYAITLGVLYAIINFLNNRNMPLVKGGDQYVVKMPNVLKYVYFALFLLGILLFVVFLFFKLKGNPSITKGNFRVALIVSLIGLLVMAWATRWKIVVDNGHMDIYKMLHKTVSLQISDLDMAEIGKKSELILNLNGKRLVVVDALCDNYDLLAEDLKKNGKL